MLFSQITYNVDSLKKNIKSNKYKSAKTKLIKLIKRKSFGFIEDLYENNFNKIQKIVQKLKKFQNVIFLGTGGSSLGGKTLVSLKKNFYTNDLNPKIFFIENVDENSIEGLLKNINLNKTAVVVISKSGETIETLSQFFYLKNKFKIFKNNVFIITENKKSTLKEIQEKEKLYFIEHKENIGGRFSIFSMVGLIPGALSGCNIENFKIGAKSILKKILKNNSENFDDYFFPSFAITSLNKKKINISVMMPYVDRLKNFSSWYKQLWAESIGKDNKGITPVDALGTVDQHSQLQLYLDGPADKFFTLIGKKTKIKNKINCKFGNKNIYSVLHNKSLEELMNAELQATLFTICKKGLPSRYIEMEKVDEKSLGSLIMFFFLETIFSSFLLNINPFDQPAVEQGKVLTKKYLKK